MMLNRTTVTKFRVAALCPLLLGAALLLTPAEDARAASVTTSLPVNTATTAMTDKIQRELEHEGFRAGNTVYIPVKDLAPMLDLQVQLNADKTGLEITGLYQAVSLKFGESKVYTSQHKVIALGAPVLVRNGVTYVPDKLFFKAFHLPVSWEGKALFSVRYIEKYMKEALGKELFWLNKEFGVLYSGPSGELPSRAGIVKVHDLDWAEMKPRKINSTSYALEISNAYGEPHINESRYRILLHEGKLVHQAVTSYQGSRILGMKENVFAFQGKIVMMDHHMLSLINPDGQPFKTYNLKEITGIDDAYALEAIDTDLLLVRPFKTGTLIFINRHTSEAVLLYKQLLSTEDQAWLEQYPVSEIDYPGDGLLYTGRSDTSLSFEWSSFTDKMRVHFTYTF